MAYNTGNPIGSTDPRDLYDNAQNLDELSNSQSKLSHPDRRGVSRKTWHAIEEQADQQESEFNDDQARRESEFDAAQADKQQRFNLLLANSGYEYLSGYAAGIEITEYNQVIRDGAGELWRAAATTTLPYTTDGAGLPEGGAFVAVGDADIRNDLAAGVGAGKGGLLVAGAVIYVDTIADLQALDTSALVDGQIAYVSGSRLKWEAGASDWRVMDYVTLSAFGGRQDGTFDDTDAMDAAIAFVTPTGAIKIDGDSPRFTRTIVLPTDSKGLYIFADKQVTINCDHNGDGILCENINYTYGGHTFENLILNGPNASYPPDAGYVPPSTGAGISFQRSYDNTLKNVRCNRFHTGCLVNVGFNNKTEGDCQFLFNQYGIRITGGATNLNNFSGSKIRENRKAGIWIDGSSGSPYPSRNYFTNCYVETNIPYAGGYPSGGPGDGSASVGILLNNTYHNDFTGVYFENQEYDFWFGDSALGNNIISSRHAGGGGNTRFGKIRFDSDTAHENTFLMSKCISNNSTPEMVEFSAGATPYNNAMYHCTGFVLPDTSLLTVIDNRIFSVSRVGDRRLAISRYSGVNNNPGEGSGITGIGTATATLDARGYGEVELGNQITAETTITEITGVYPGQLLMLVNYQNSYPVTIADSGGNAGIQLNGQEDVVLKTYNDSITFFVSRLGSLIEIGRTTQNYAQRNVSMGALAAGEAFLKTVNMPEAKRGDSVVAAHQHSIGGCSISAHVNTDGVVSVVIANNTGASVTIGSGYLGIRKI